MGLHVEVGDQEEVISEKVLHLRQVDIRLFGLGSEGVGALELLQLLLGGPCVGLIPSRFGEHVDIGLSEGELCLRCQGVGGVGVDEVAELLGGDGVVGYPLLLVVADTQLVLGLRRVGGVGEDLDNLAEIGAGLVPIFLHQGEALLEEVLGGGALLQDQGLFGSGAATGNDEG